MQIVWESYMQILGSLPTYCTTGQHIWRAEVPLIYFWIVEGHHPERVFYQFGMKQPLPESVDMSSNLHRISLQGKWEKDWAVEHAVHIQQWGNRGQLVHATLLLDDDTTYLVEYKRWYNGTTRRFDRCLGLYRGATKVLSDNGGGTPQCTFDVGAGPSHTAGHEDTVPTQTISRGASKDYEDPPRMSSLVFSGSAHDGGCIFVPTPGMPTPHLVHVEPIMGPSSLTPHKEAIQIEQIPGEDIKPVEGLQRSRCPPTHAPDYGTGDGKMRPVKAYRRK
ncbi:hypothetical protein SO802_023937 [Lithocarpus litseifolius]|uniref:Aminotransferase-like plant mobile domain-containing protein n=1 Tax=Lithocarpus litseifolius TaxID=425828 RepID=A0AAW2CBG4_9ROSI